MSPSPRITMGTRDTHRTLHLSLKTTWSDFPNDRKKVINKKKYLLKSAWLPCVSYERFTKLSFVEFFQPNLLTISCRKYKRKVLELLALHKSTGIRMKSNYKLLKKKYSLRFFEIERNYVYLTVR